ncbi:unnamed protein product, partial [Amoebophrya sp. A25]
SNAQIEIAEVEEERESLLMQVRSQPMRKSGERFQYPQWVKWQQCHWDNTCLVTKLGRVDYVQPVSVDPRMLAQLVNSEAGVLPQNRPGSSQQGPASSGRAAASTEAALGGAEGSSASLEGATLTTSGEETSEEEALGGAGLETGTMVETVRDHTSLFDASLPGDYE